MHAQEEWDPARFRELLARIQEQTGLDDAGIGELAGRSRSMVNKWRTAAKHRPAYEPVARLARELVNRFGKEAVGEQATDLLVAAGYASEATKPTGELVIDPDIELPEGFDPHALPRAELEIFLLHDTPLNVRQLLVQTRRLAMGDAVPGLRHVTKRTPDTNGGLSASN